MTVFDKMRPRPIPDYYSTMYLDGYKPWEILEAAHRTLYKQAMEREEEHAAAQQPDVPMNVKFNVEVKTK